MPLPPSTPPEADSGVGAATAAAGSDRRRAVVAWSSGKDAAWALATALRAGVDVVGLVTTVTEDDGRVGIHEVAGEVVARQAGALGLPLHRVPLPWPCPDLVYRERMRAALGGLVATGVTEMIFGDLFLADIRAFREELMRGTGVTPRFPLFGSDTAALAGEMVAAGVRATVVAVDTSALPGEFAGRPWDREFVAALPPGVDPCGENGEFHTLATDGPAFHHPLAVRVTGRADGPRAAVARIALA